MMTRCPARMWATPWREKGKAMHTTHPLHERAGTISRSRGAIETKEVPTEDHLLEVISDIETRLSHIRESQARRSQLEVELLERTEELSERESQIETREMSLLAEERAISDRAQSVTLESERLESHRREMERRLRELQERHAELERREQNTASRAEDLDSERSELQALQRQIESQGTDIAEREALIRAQVDAIDAERRSVAEHRGQIETERRILAETAHKQAEQSRQLKELAGELESREAEFAQRMNEYEQLKAQLDVMQTELSSTRKSAASTAEEAVQQQKKAEELQRRCAELEAEREKFRVELSRTRVQLDASAKAAVAAPVRLPDATRQHHPLAVGMWLVSTVTAAAAAVAAIQTGTLVVAATIFGVAFAFMMLMSQGIARRMWDTGVLPIAAFFAAGGLWFERWVGVLGTALETWQLPGSLGEVASMPGLPLALGVCSAGLVANMGMYLVTRSEAVMGNVFFGTVLATVLVLLPGNASAMGFAAAVTWMALAAASMGVWAVKTARGTRPHTSPAARGRVL